MLNWIRSTWCKKVHTDPMWPMHGRYICRRCLREYPVSWEGPATTAEFPDAAVRRSSESSPYAAEHPVC